VTLLGPSDAVIGSIAQPIAPSADRTLDYGNKFVDLGIQSINVQ